MSRAKDSGVVLGGVVLAAALVLFVSVLSGALLGGPAAPSLAPEVATAEGPATVLAPATGGVEPASSTPAPHTSDALSNETLAMAVERAPFDPDRQAPYARYLLPEERVVEAPPPSAPPPPPPPPFRVLGTIATPNGGVAVLQLEDEPPLVVAVGQEIEGYRVASVDGGRVQMSGQGRSFSLQMEAAAPTAVTAARGNRNQQQERGNARGAANNQGRGQAQPAFSFDFRAGDMRINGEQIDINNPALQERMQEAIRRLEQQQQERGGGNQTRPTAGRGGQTTRTVPRPPGS